MLTDQQTLTRHPQKVALKKSKSCAKFVAEIAQKIGKVARVANFAHFWM